MSPPAPTAPPTKVNVYRYYKHSVGDHFYTINPSEIGTTIPGQVGKGGYKFEGIIGSLESADTEMDDFGVGVNAVDLHRYWNSQLTDHLYTTDPDEIGTITPGQTGNLGYKYESSLGLCFKLDDGVDVPAGLVPLYRYYRAAVENHFYTTNPDEIGTITPGQTGRWGYKSEGTECYIYSEIVTDVDVAAPLSNEGSVPNGEDGSFSDFFPMVLGAAAGVLAISAVVAAAVAMRKRKTAATKSKVEMKAVHIPDDSVAPNTVKETETEMDVVAEPKQNVGAVATE